MTGRPQARQPQGGWPSLGSSVSKLQGPVTASRAAVRRPVAEDEDDGLGRSGPAGLPRPGYAPFLPNADGLADMTLKGVTLDQLDDRKSLLCEFRPPAPRPWTPPASWKAPTQFTRQALAILTSSKLAEALDLEREDRGSATATAAARPTRPATATPARC